MLYFCPLASGSSGNAALVATENTSVLIDCGISAKRIESALKTLGYSPQSLSGIFVTHEHSDHINGISVLSRRYNLPVFATPPTWAAMEQVPAIESLAPANRRFIYRGENFVIGDMSIRPFAISHDAAEPVGFSVITGTGQRKLAYATDVGCVTTEIMDELEDAHILCVEANHDVQMLKEGSYPAYLKKRVMGERGHLSNVSCGSMLKEIINKRMSSIYLAHLSLENNRPQVAFDTVSAMIYQTEGPDLMVAHRTDPSRPTVV